LRQVKKSRDCRAAFNTVGNFASQLLYLSRDQLALMFWVRNIELLASLFDCCFFVGCRDDANVLGVILAHPVNTPNAGHLPQMWSMHGEARWWRHWPSMMGLLHF
jgi:hypothetical protein